MLHHKQQLQFPVKEVTFVRFIDLARPRKRLALPRLTARLITRLASLINCRFAGGGTGSRRRVIAARTLVPHEVLHAGTAEGRFIRHMRTG